MIRVQNCATGLEGQAEKLQARFREGTFSHKVLVEAIDPAPLHVIP